MFYILSKSQKGTEPFLHIRSVVLVLFLMGGIAFFRASYFNEIDRILSKKTLTGTLIGQVEYVRQNAEGEYQITVRENSFVVNENHLKDGIKRI